ncbi:MAG: hypothetical protein ACPGYV_09765, partial [Phycisphaeraceae bacterium]
MAATQNKSSLARILVPLIVGLVGLMVILSLMRSGPENEPIVEDAPAAVAQAEPETTEPGRSDPPDNADDDTPDADSEGEAEADPQPPLPVADPAATADDDAANDADQASSAVDGDVGPLTNLRPAFAETLATASDADPDDLIRIGSADPASDFELLAEINPYRACVHRATLSQVAIEVNGEARYVLLHPLDLNRGDQRLYPTIGSYAAQKITINGKDVPLAKPEADNNWRGHWNLASRSDTHATLTLTIQGGPDDAPADIVKLTRTYRTAPGSHTVQLEQAVENLTDEPLDIRWSQLAQSDVHYETNDYLRGRSRQYVTGYFRDDYDAKRFSIYVDDGFISRPDLIGKLKEPSADNKWQSIWPNPKTDDGDNTLAWLASENRYFVVALGLWLLFLAIVFLLTKKRPIKWIYSSLAVVALFAIL